MRYHGVDLHKRFASVSLRDEGGAELRCLPRVADFAGYVAALTVEDAVALESSSGTFWWAERIQRQGARCMIIDPYRFRIIRDSWHKTDRREAAAFSLALWMSAQSGELVLPEVWQPTPAVRELRRLFSQWQLLNTQIRQLKAQVQGVLMRRMASATPSLAVGSWTTPWRPSRWWPPWSCPQMRLQRYDEPGNAAYAGRAKKKKLQREIYRAGQPFDEQVRLLIGIRGVTPLLALGFLSEVGDIRRFRSLRGLLAYLGVLPTVRSSGGSTHVGHLNRRSRSLTRTLFTQAVLHLAASSPLLGRFYRDLVERKGHGRTRIAVLRKIIGMMRRMLLSNTQYRWKQGPFYESNLMEYVRILDLEEKPKEAA